VCGLVALGFGQRAYSYNKGVFAHLPAPVYNFQTKKGKFIQIDSQFSSNPKWKNKYFFVSRQWEFTPTEKAKGPKVPRDINDPPAEAYEEPVLTPEMIHRVNKVIKWG
jgi:hypothetical protein